MKKIDIATKKVVRSTEGMELMYETYDVVGFPNRSIYVWTDGLIEMVSGGSVIRKGRKDTGNGKEIMWCASEKTGEYYLKTRM